MMISTIYGEMEESQLVKKTGMMEDDNEIMNWVEYWLNDELVHRSVDLQLKRGLDFGLDAASLV